MPGMGGKEVAERVSALRPDIRVLYMSGYAESVITAQGTVDAGVALVSKPFSESALTLAVSHALAAVDP